VPALRSHIRVTGRFREVSHPLEASAHGQGHEQRTALQPLLGLHEHARTVRLEELAVAGAALGKGIAYRQPRLELARCAGLDEAAEVVFDAQPFDLPHPVDAPSLAVRQVTPQLKRPAGRSWRNSASKTGEYTRDSGRRAPITGSS